MPTIRSTFAALLLMLAAACGNDAPPAPPTPPPAGAGADANGNTAPSEHTARTNAAVKDLYALDETVDFEEAQRGLVET